MDLETAELDDISIGSNAVDLWLDNFEFSEEDNETAVENNRNRYLQWLEQNTDLFLLQAERAKYAYEKDGKYGLFTLFITKSMFNCIRVWTNANLKAKGMKTVCSAKFKAYLGLELATSLIHMNDLKQYWSNKVFQGQQDYKDTMSRDDFLNIRSNLVFCHPDMYNHEQASRDPLWHSRKLLEHFQKNIAAVAVPCGSSALDEASVGTKARSGAVTYLPSKPDKYAVRFYAVVGTTNSYIHSFVDNRSGNTTGECGGVAYSRVNRQMRTPYNKVFQNNKFIKKDSASAMWILQMAHQCKMRRDRSGKRVFFCDNYYTRHHLATALKKITDGEAVLVGTVKYNIVDGTNRVYLKQAINMIEKEKRGAWLLVRAYECHPDLEKLRYRWNQDQQKKPPKRRKPFVCPTDILADKAGYIVWKDKNTVVFYTNDLLQTPSRPILDSGKREEYDEAVGCVRGVGKVDRWYGEEMLHRSQVEVPVFIVAYNKYMNSVDRMDQKRSTNPTKRKEQRLGMSIFTYLLDLCVLQSFSVYKKLQPDKNEPLSEYKRALCEELIDEVKMEKL